MQETQDTQNPPETSALDQMDEWVLAQEPIERLLEAQELLDYVVRGRARDLLNHLDAHSGEVRREIRTALERAGYQSDARAYDAFDRAELVNDSVRKVRIVCGDAYAGWRYLVVPLDVFNGGTEAFSQWLVTLLEQYRQAQKEEAERQRQARLMELEEQERAELARLKAKYEG